MSFDCAQNVIPVLEQQLSMSSLKLGDAEAFAVTVGPGSYTGLRVGVIVAKTLAYAFQKPLIGVPSVELFAATAAARFAVLLDAKMGGVYCALAEMKNSEIQFGSPFAVSLAELPLHLEGISHWVSPHFLRLQERCPLLRSLEGEEVQPSSELMRLAALRRWENSEYSLDYSLDILYLKRTQAEMEKESQKQ